MYKSVLLTKLVGMSLVSFQLVVDWTLVRGVGRQMEAFKEGFNSVFLLSSLQGLIYPGEVRGGHGGGRKEGRGGEGCGGGRR